MDSMYALLYTYGTFDDSVLAFADEDFELDAKQLAQIEHDETIPPLNDEMLRDAALRFRAEHGANIVGIKLCADIESFVVLFKGPAHLVTVVGNTTIIPQLPAEVRSRVWAWPEHFGDFHRGMYSDVTVEGAFGDTWLE